VSVVASERPEPRLAWKGSHTHFRIALMAQKVIYCGEAVAVEIHDLCHMLSQRARTANDVPLGDI
jgi:hypothetical protein